MSLVFLCVTVLDVLEPADCVEDLLCFWKQPDIVFQTACCPAGLQKSATTGGTRSPCKRRSVGGQRGCWRGQAPPPGWWKETPLSDLPRPDVSITGTPELSQGSTQSDATVGGVSPGPSELACEGSLGC